MKNNKNKIILPDGHILRSRRDFLSHGFIAAASSLAMPSLLSMLTSKMVHGADCIVNENIIGKTPIFILDLAGGANLPGSNVMVGAGGGQEDYLKTYKTLGLPEDMNPKNNINMINTEFGLRFHADSAILRGMQSQTSTAVRAKVEGGIFCASSSDDTQNNPLNPSYWLYKAGATGTIVNLVGTRNSDSGGNSKVPMISMNPKLKPVSINKPEDALNLINIGRINEIFNKDQAQVVLKAIEKMSQSKLQSFTNQTLPEQIKNLVECGYIKSQDVFNQYTPELIDANQDLDVRAVFGNLDTDVKRQVATMAKLLLDGYVGAATVAKGGNDYHNKTRATGEARDFEAGEIIGQVMALAARKRKNIIIYVFTDGGVAAADQIDNSAAGRGKYVWTGDSGQRSSAFLLTYRDQGKPTLRTGNRQIGYFRENGSVETSASLTSNSPTNLAKAVVANFLALHGEESSLASVVGDNPFGSDLDKYIFFNKL